MSASAARQRPLLEWSPAAPAARAFLKLAAALERDDLALTGSSGHPADFFERSVVRLLEGPIRPPEAAAARQGLAANPAAARLDAALALAATLETLEHTPVAQGIIAALRTALAEARAVLAPAAPAPQALVPLATALVPAAPALASTVQAQAALAQKPLATPLPDLSVEEGGSARDSRTATLSTSRDTIQSTIDNPKHTTIRTTEHSPDQTASPSPLRVSILSTDPVMGDILEESLASSGMLVTRLTTGTTGTNSQETDARMRQWQARPPQVLVVQIDGHSRADGSGGQDEFDGLFALDASGHIQPNTPLVVVDGFARRAQSALPGLQASARAGQAGRITEVVPAPFRVEALVAAVRRCARTQKVDA
jgi:hypothetical protein